MNTAEEIVDGLRVVHEHAVVTAALNALRKSIEAQLGGGGGSSGASGGCGGDPELPSDGSARTMLEGLAGEGHGWVEVWAIWRAQRSQQDNAVTLALLRACTAIVGAGSAANAAALSPAAAAAVHAFGTTLLTRERKGIYFHLSSTERARSSQALQLLTRTVALSSHHVQLFLDLFDFSLAALPLLAKPPKLSQSDASSVQGRWDARAVAKRPSRALFCRFVLQLLHTAAAGQGVSQLLRTPNLLDLVMASISRDPPHFVRTLCSALLERVLHPGAEVSQDTTAALFSAAALAQLARVSRQPPDRTQAACEASALAHKVLMTVTLAESQVAWTRAQEHVHEFMPVAAEASLLDSTGEAGVARWGPFGAGYGVVSVSNANVLHAQPAVLALSQQLHYSSSAHHLELLLHLTRCSPALAMRVLGTVQVASKDLDTAEVALGVVQSCAASAASRAASIHSALATGCDLPAPESKQVQDWLADCLPASLSTAAYSKAIQSSQADLVKAALQAMAAQLSLLCPVACALRLHSPPAAEQVCSTPTDAQPGSPPRGSNVDAAQRQDAARLQAVLSQRVRHQLVRVPVLWQLLETVFWEWDFEPRADSNSKPQPGHADSRAADGAVAEWTGEQRREIVLAVLKVLRLLMCTATETWSERSLTPWKLLEGSKHTATDSVEALCWIGGEARVEFLRLLACSLALRLPCAEVEPAAATWSAAFLKQLWRLRVRVPDQASKQLCDTVFQKVLARVGLHVGPDVVILPWVLRLGPFAAALEAPAQTALFDFLASFLTTTARRPQETLALISAATETWRRSGGAGPDDGATPQLGAAGRSHSDDDCTAVAAGMLMHVSALQAALGLFKVRAAEAAPQHPSSTSPPRCADSNTPASAAPTGARRSAEGCKASGGSGAAMPGREAIWGFVAQVLLDELAMVEDVALCAYTAWFTLLQGLPVVAEGTAGNASPTQGQQAGRTHWAGGSGGHGAPGGGWRLHLGPFSEPLAQLLQELLLWLWGVLRCSIQRPRKRVRRGSSGSGAQAQGGLQDGHVFMNCFLDGGAELKMRLRELPSKHRDRTLTKGVCVEVQLQRGGCEDADLSGASAELLAALGAHLRVRRRGCWPLSNDSANTVTAGGPGSRAGKGKVAKRGRLQHALEATACMSGTASWGLLSVCELDCGQKQTLVKEGEAHSIGVAQGPMGAASQLLAGVRDPGAARAMLEWQARDPRGFDEMLEAQASLCTLYVYSACVRILRLDSACGWQRGCAEDGETALRADGGPRGGDANAIAAVYGDIVRAAALIASRCHAVLAAQGPWIYLHAFNNVLMPQLWPSIHPGGCLAASAARSSADAHSSPPVASHEAVPDAGGVGALPVDRAASGSEATAHLAALAFQALEQRLRYQSSEGTSSREAQHARVAGLLAPLGGPLQGRLQSAIRAAALRKVPTCRPSTIAVQQEACTVHGALQVSAGSFLAACPRAELLAAVGKWLPRTALAIAKNEQAVSIAAAAFVAAAAAMRRSTCAETRPQQRVHAARRGPPAPASGLHRHILQHVIQVAGHLLGSKDTQLPAAWCRDTVAAVPCSECVSTRWWERACSAARDCLWTAFELAAVQAEAWLLDALQPSAQVLLGVLPSWPTASAAAALRGVQRVIKQDAESARLAADWMVTELAAGECGAESASSKQQSSRRAGKPAALSPKIAVLAAEVFGCCGAQDRANGGLGSEWEAERHMEQFATAVRAPALAALLGSDARDGAVWPGYCAEALLQTVMGCFRYQCLQHERWSMLLARCAPQAGVASALLAELRAAHASQGPEEYSGSSADPQLARDASPARGPCAQHTEKNCARHCAADTCQRAPGLQLQRLKLVSALVQAEVQDDQPPLVARAGGGGDTVPQLAQILTSCVKTLEGIHKLEPGRSTEQRSQRFVEPAQAFLQSLIDRELGDSVVQLHARGLCRHPACLEIAHAARDLLRLAVQAPARSNAGSDVAGLECARRLWAALVPDEDQTGSPEAPHHDDTLCEPGGEPEAETQSVSVAEHGLEDCGLHDASPDRCKSVAEPEAVERNSDSDAPDTPDDLGPCGPCGSDGGAPAPGRAGGAAAAVAAAGRRCDLDEGDAAVAEVALAALDSLYGVLAADYLQVPLSVLAPVPKAVAEASLPLDSVVQLWGTADGVRDKRKEATFREALLKTLETLFEVACFHSGLVIALGSDDVASAKQAESGRQHATPVTRAILCFVDKALPQLLANYHATMHPEDVVMSRLMYTLDRVLTSHSRTAVARPVAGRAGVPSLTSDGAQLTAETAPQWPHGMFNVGRMVHDAEDASGVGGGSIGFLTLVGYAWGPAWLAGAGTESGVAEAGHRVRERCPQSAGEVAMLAVAQPAIEDEDASQPDIERALLQVIKQIEPRRVALTICAFPASRSLAMDEADPYSLGLQPAWFADSAEAAAAYDPAWLLPCLDLLLRRGLLSAAASIKTGALALLLRALAVDDYSLRCVAYNSVAAITASLADEALQTVVRPAQALCMLLRLLQNSVEEAYQRLPVAVAVFMAEAAVVLCNETAALHEPVSKFILKAAALKTQGTPMFMGMFAAPSPDFHARRMWADAFAFTAAACACPQWDVRPALLGAALACGSADVAAFSERMHAAVRVLAQAACSSAAARHAVRHGEVAAVGALVVRGLQELGRLASSAVPAQENIAQGLRGSVTTAMAFMHAVSGIRRLFWRDLADLTVAQLCTAIASVSGKLACIWGMQPRWVPAEVWSDGCRLQECTTDLVEITRRIPSTVAAVQGTAPRRYLPLHESVLEQLEYLVARATETGGNHRV